MRLRGYLTTANGPDNTLHRGDCGHGQRSHASNHAIEVTGTIARILYNASRAGADPFLRPCGLCRPDVNGLAEVKA